MWTCISISQNLEPIVYNFQNRKYFCFDVEQSRFIAKRLEYSLYQDSLIDTLKLRSYRWQHLLRKKDTTILKLESKIGNFLRIQENDKTHIQELNLIIKKQQKQIKRNKLQQWLLGGGLLIVTGIIIAQ